MSLVEVGTGYVVAVVVTAAALFCCLIIGVWITRTMDALRLAWFSDPEPCELEGYVSVYDRECPHCKVRLIYDAGYPGDRETEPEPAGWFCVECNFELVDSGGGCDA